MKKHVEHSGSAVITEGAKSPAFTPGPWNVVHFGTCYGIRSDDGHLVAETNPASKSRHAAQHDIHGDAEESANACLIAAAPDLLAALGQYVRETDGRTGGDTYDKAVSAIAKATGAA